MKIADNKLGLLSLTMLVIGGIIGSGIFSLPQNMAEGAGAGAILIAWIITFVGMLSLTRAFQYLSLRLNHIKDGLYGYVREGFGDYIGFNAAWGYWLSALMSCGSYLVILFSALGSFSLFSFFGEGTTFLAFIGGLITLWLLHALILQGIYSAAILNSLVTIAKVIPIGLFIICIMLTFHIDTFSADFWGSPQLGSILKQVKSTMLYTVWVYLGIESATVYASRARYPIDVSRATFLGFFLTTILLMCVSILSLGIVPQSVLATMKNPSMALVMEHAVGHWGAVFINIGLIISVSGALLSWLMLAAEMLYLASKGKDHTLPCYFGILNSVGTPTKALWLTSLFITGLLLLAYLNESGYNTLIKLSTSMILIPYLLSAIYMLKLALISKNTLAIMIGTIATIYGIWLIYAGGLKYLLLSMILYSVGFGFYSKARKQRDLPLFNHRAEKIYAIAIILLGIIALGYFFNTLIH